MESKSMSVISGGGDGGAGQNGGDGRNGSDGSNAKLSDVRENEFYMCDEPEPFWFVPQILEQTPKCTNHQQFLSKEEIPQEVKNKINTNYGTSATILLSNYYHYFYEKGKNGVRGGNGGRGGCGGVSGSSGQSVIIAHQNRINVTKESSYTQKHGRKGESGNVGSGGRNGATAKIKKGLIIKSGNKHGLRIYQRENERFLVESNTYADSGIQPDGCSQLDYKQSAPSDTIAIYKLETEYLKFTNDQSSKLVHIDLMNRPFLYNIMNGTSEMPSLQQLIERVEVLTPNEPLKNVGGNEILLRKMLPVIDSYSAKTETVQLVGNFTRAAVLSAIYRHKAAQQTNIVVGLQSFLEQSISFSDEWESLTEFLASQVHRKKIIVEYTKSYESRNKQANDVLVELQRDIDLNHLDLSENINKVVDEIIKLKEKKQTDAEDLNRKKSELQESLKKQQLFGVVKIAFTTFAMAATIVVSPAAAPILGLANALIPKVIDSFDEELPAVPFNLKDRVWADALALDINRSKQCNKYPENGLINSNRKKRSVAERSSKVEAIRTKLEENQEKSSKYADLVSPVAEALSQTLKNNEAGHEKMKLIEEAIESNLADMHNLNKAKDKMSCLNGEIIDAMFTNISDMVQKQSGQSGVYLRMSKYKLKRIIDDFKAEMFQLIKHFESKGLVDTTFKRLENAILAINDVYGLSEAYKDQISLATYIADMTKPTAIHIPAEYELQVASLKKKILASVVSQKYEQARRAFGLRSFPFFCVYDERAKASTHGLQTGMKGKLKENTPFLSPYTLWKMQIIPQNIEGEKLNKTLKEIESLFEKNQVDVSLGGTGKYISDKKNELDMSCDGGPRPYRNY